MIGPAGGSQDCFHLGCILPAKDLLMHLNLTFSPSLRHCVTGIVFPTNEFSALCLHADGSSVPFLLNWITVSNDPIRPVSPTVAFSPQEDMSVCRGCDCALWSSMLWLQCVCVFAKRARQPWRQKGDAVLWHVHSHVRTWEVRIKGARGAKRGNAFGLGGTIRIFNLEVPLYQRLRKVFKCSRIKAPNIVFGLYLREQDTV